MKHRMHEISLRGNHVPLKKGKQDVASLPYDELLWKRLKSKSTSLLFQDAFFTILQTFQVFVLMLSMSLYWPWPEYWIRRTRFVFFINLDVWDFLKLQLTGVYLSRQNGYTSSSSIPVPYYALLFAWVGILVCLLTMYITIYIILKMRHSPFMLYQIARLKKVYIIILQILYIPFGVVIARVFHCNDDNQADVSNSLTCYNGVHWIYVLISFGIGVVYIVGLPAWMILKIRKELLSMSFPRHEAYLQLKEAEYSLSLDSSWYLDHFFLFSSFKKYGAYTRPISLIIYGSFCIIFAALRSSFFVQILLIMILLILYCITLCIIRPYRVTAYTVYAILCILYLFSNSMMAVLRAGASPTSAAVWLNPSYLGAILTIIQVLALVVTIIFVLYVLIRYILTVTCSYRTLWPILSPSPSCHISANTNRFIEAALTSRLFLEEVYKGPALFARADEIGRHIHIINALCREAELLKDPMLDSLWDILDLLVDAHAQIAPKSLYAESVKPSIKRTVKELEKLMPEFVQRLAQREYDLILASPVKRRLLLKMFCMSLLLHRDRDKSLRHQLTKNQAVKVWKIEEQIHTTGDDYYEEIYPEIEVRPSVVLSSDKDTLALLKEDICLEVEEELPVYNVKGAVPPAFTNLVFQDDESDTSSFVRGTDQQANRSIFGSQRLPGSFAEPVESRSVFGSQRLPGSFAKPVESRSAFGTQQLPELQNDNMLSRENSNMDTAGWNQESQDHTVSSA